MKVSEHVLGRVWPGLSDVSNTGETWENLTRTEQSSIKGRKLGDISLAKRDGIERNGRIDWNVRHYHENCCRNASLTNKMLHLRCECKLQA